MEFPTDNKGLAYVEDFDAVMGDFLQQNPLRYHPPSGLYYIFDNNRGCYNVLDDNQTKRKIKKYLGGVWNPKVEASFLAALPVYAKTIKDFNNLKNKLICKNGVLDLERKVLLPFSPKYYSTFALNVEYRKDAVCPTYERFKRDIACGNPALMATYDELLGYIISDSMDAEKLFCMGGSGSNGKSTYMALLTSFLGGDSVSTIPIKEINGRPFSRHFLANKKLNIIYEGESSMTISNLFSGTVKSIITGDPISAEIKMGKCYSFVASCKLVMATNTLPRIDTIPDYAILRRYLILPFNNTFTAENVDKGMGQKLLAEQSGILNRAVEGLERLKKNQYVFSCEEDSKEYLRNMIKEEYPVFEFAEQRIIADEEKRVSYNVMRTAYRSWCITNGVPYLISEREFASQIKQYLSSKRIPYDTFKAGNDRGITGIDII